MKKTMGFYLYLMIIISNISLTFGQSQAPNVWIRPAVGINRTFNTLHQNNICDKLLAFDEFTTYSQFISAIFFSKKKPKLGFSLNVQNAQNQKINDKHNQFAQQINGIYGNQYISEIFTSADLENSNFFTGNILSGSFGLSYKTNHRKITLIPSIEIGTTSFSSHHATVHLKERNTNQVVEIKYNDDKIGANDFFTTSMSIYAGYKISPKCYISANFALYHYKSNVIFEETITNQHTLASISQYFDYNKNIFGTTIGLGILWTPNLYWLKRN